MQNMPTRKLTPEEREKAAALLAVIRAKRDEISGGNKELKFAFNRKLWKELLYDERGTPTERRALKRLKYEEQKGLCFDCGKPLEPKGRNAELDRIEAMDGYIAPNVRLVHHQCHRSSQEARKFQG